MQARHQVAAVASPRRLAEEPLEQIASQTAWLQHVDAVSTEAVVQRTEPLLGCVQEQPELAAYGMSAPSSGLSVALAFHPSRQPTSRLGPGRAKRSCRDTIVEYSALRCSMREACTPAELLDLGQTVCPDSAMQSTARSLRR